MTVEVVPYVEQNLSHSAALFRQAFASGWTSGGICTAGELAVSAQSSPNMSVQVAAGRAIVPGTNVTPPAGFAFTTQGDYFVLNDATISVTVSAANATNPRIDVAYVGVQDAFYSGATNTAIIGIVTGTPAPSPAVPAIPTNAIALAQIAVAANATSIVGANITNVAVIAASVASPAQGLTLLTPASVAVGSGSFTLGKNGLVTFSGASTISLNGFASSAYDVYRIMVEFDTSSSASGINMRARNAGVDQAGSLYNVSVQHIVDNGTQDFTGSVANGTAAVVGRVTSIGMTAIEIHNLARTLNTIGTATGYDNGYMSNSGFTLQDTTAYDGITLIQANAGTLGGRLRVYGYNPGY